MFLFVAFLVAFLVVLVVLLCAAALGYAVHRRPVLTQPAIVAVAGATALITAVGVIVAVAAAAAQ
ncbi:hypothetical protein [Streptomyces tsukubensis]|uniref:hypothetical protein n=1 Tax=Streptomyces tsukubensis TaxID=83656 RepID=UPI00344C4AF8